MNLPQFLKARWIEGPDITAAQHATLLQVVEYAASCQHVADPDQRQTYAGNRSAGAAHAAEQILRTLAAAYANHPDYEPRMPL